METCQHCNMYMEPFLSPATDASLGEASCEFCGKTIARIKEKDGKSFWVKEEPLTT